MWRLECWKWGFWPSLHEAGWLCPDWASAQAVGTRRFCLNDQNVLNQLTYPLYRRLSFISNSIDLCNSDYYSCLRLSINCLLTPCFRPESSCLHRFDWHCLLGPIALFAKQLNKHFKLYKSEGPLSTQRSMSWFQKINNGKTYTSLMFQSYMHNPFARWCRTRFRSCSIDLPNTRWKN